ncbi:MAG: type II secretion system protein [Phycisphaerae bacterium]|nr:type II secretion system protein [Phycisphaerae bacterium]
MITIVLRKFRRVRVSPSAFTLVELLVTLAIITVLFSIILPTYSYMRYRARSVINIANQRSISSSVTMYAGDNRDRCPDSVATVGFGNSFNWAEPTKLIGNNFQGPGDHRAVSEYLGQYISKADVMNCANAPRPPYPYLQEAWDAGDQWDNPDTIMGFDPLGGTFCYYWGYIGYQVDRQRPYYGPRRLSGNNKYSKLLVSDYLGYDHWRSPGAFGSCEKFESSARVPETWLLSSYWAGSSRQDSDAVPEMKLNAGYIDGCVKSYNSKETIQMKVSLSADGTIPYIDGLGPGIYYLPQ